MRLVRGSAAVDAALGLKQVAFPSACGGACGRRWAGRSPGAHWRFWSSGGLALVLPPLIHRDTALREFRWTIAEPLLFFALIARFVRSDDDLLRVLNAFLITAAVGGSIGAQQFLYGETWSMEGVGRATGVWPGATAFGIFMGRALPLALVLALFLPGAPRWRRWRWAYGLLALPIAAGLITSFARGAWLGVAPAIVVVILLTRNRWLLIGLAAGTVAMAPVLCLLRRGRPAVQPVRRGWAPARAASSSGRERCACCATIA